MIWDKYLQCSNCYREGSSAKRNDFKNGESTPHILKDNGMYFLSIFSAIGSTKKIYVSDFSTIYNFKIVLLVPQISIFIIRINDNLKFRKYEELYESFQKRKFY